jgi:hypothetical protein
MLKTTANKLNKLPLPAIAVSLWLATVVLATWNILVIRSMVLRTYVRFMPVNAGGEAMTLVNTILLLVLAVAWIAVAVGGAEYHYKRIGQLNSWKLFSRTLAVEISILILALFI